LSEEIRSWIEDSGYGASLGVKLDDLAEGAARLKLPFAERNSNPGKALHGGCAASLALIGAQAVTRAALGAEAGPFHTAGLQVNYLAAAIGEDVVASATLRRRGKELCFVEVDVATQAGKSIARVTSMVRGRFGAEPAIRVAATGDDGAAQPGAMGPHVSKLRFCAERALEVQHMSDSHSRIVMPWSESNADGEGGVHEGALLALFDTTGAMAAWADAGPGPYKASTPSIQAQILAPAPRQDLVAYGKCVQRDGDLFWCDVEIAGKSGEQPGALVARGTVIYRIVT
jgi:uncharacterized protein (TIGR00369 family)